MIQVLHRAYDVQAEIETEQHGWIATVPLALEGSWFFIYNDKLTAKRLVHIPFGNVFAMRSDVYYGGCLGTAGNCWMQSSFLVIWLNITVSLVMLVGTSFSVMALSILWMLIFVLHLAS